jgi:uncharacterized protein YlxW (UPF0749 family)
MADAEEKPPRRTRTAEIADATSEGLARIGRLSPQQAMTIICVVLMGFVCCAQAFQAWSERQERKEATREREAAAASAIRENNAQAELNRQHCAAEAKELRAFFAEQREKDRAALAALVAKLEALERALGKRGE